MVTALVGSSGSGKSTTIGLISAFYVPTKGEILLDGIDLSTVRLDSYRTRLGVVLQESFLFDGTIRENVSFSRPDASEKKSCVPAGSRGSMNLRKRLPTSTKQWSESAALNFPAASGSGSRLPAPFWPSRAS
jgi:ABC-type transport system involved in cytochrome bd biosynthesis fused ATPase/permease subunit